MVMPQKVKDKDAMDDKQPQRWWGSFVKKEQREFSDVEESFFEDRIWSFSIPFLLVEQKKR